jgi:2-methylisocitrate lyase-like PEP mutase family enzyme
LLSAGAPTIRELEQMGVARASAGSGVMRASLGYARRVARELLEAGTYNSMLDGAVPFAELMTMLSRLKN